MGSEMCIRDSGQLVHGRVPQRTQQQLVGVRSGEHSLEVAARKLGDVGPQDLLRRANEEPSTEK